MKKIIFILILLISVFYIINIVNDNGDVLQNDTSSLKINHENVIKSKQNIKAIAIKGANSNKASIRHLSESTFDDLTQEEVRYVQRDCGEYLYTSSFVEEFVDDYKNMYLTTRKKAPSKQQINAALKVAKKCDQYRRFQNDIENTVYGYDLSFEEDAFEIAKQHGDQEANKYLESHLFDKDMSTRLSAARLLRTKSWINSVNQFLDIPNTTTIDESFVVMPSAIMFRECELGLYDCSENSFMVLSECPISPLACGRDFRGIIELSLTGYQLDLFNKYLTYLRSL